MKKLEKVPSLYGAIVALFLSSIGAFCLFVAVMVTVHAIENGGRLNQALLLTLRWFEHVYNGNDRMPNKEQLELQPSVESDREMY